MKRLIFKDIQFVKSCAQLSQCPQLKDDQGVLLPQVAVAGRSNVGKSSLLNHLFQRKDLVKTSQKPGKTRLLNFFRVDKECLFCDLPGYGYAKVSEKMKDQWKKMIESYIERPKELHLLLLLLDARRTPSEQDHQFFEWVQHFQHPIVCVLTKVDKISKNEHARQRAKILKLFNLPSESLVSYSVTKNIGRKELAAIINQRINCGIDE